MCGWRKGKNIKIITSLHKQQFLILFFFYKGKLCDASARYERAIQEEPGEIGHHKVECYSVLHNGWFLCNNVAFWNKTLFGQL